MAQGKGECSRNRGGRVACSTTGVVELFGGRAPTFGVLTLPTHPLANVGRGKIPDACARRNTRDSPNSNGLRADSFSSVPPTGGCFDGALGKYPCERGTRDGSPEAPHSSLRTMGILCGLSGQERHLISLPGCNAFGPKQ